MHVPPPNDMYEPERPLRLVPEGFWIGSLRLDEIRAALAAQYQLAGVKPAETRERR